LLGTVIIIIKPSFFHVVFIAVVANLKNLQERAYNVSATVFATERRALADQSFVFAAVASPFGP
jgi:hypothetical protein